MYAFVPTMDLGPESKVECCGEPDRGSQCMPTETAIRELQVHGRASTRAAQHMAAWLLLEAHRHDQH